MTAPGWAQLDAPHGAFGTLGAGRLGGTSGSRPRPRAPSPAPIRVGKAGVTYFIKYLKGPLPGLPTHRPRGILSRPGRWPLGPPSPRQSSEQEAAVVSPG